MSHLVSTLRLRTSWGTVRVEARGGKIARCTLPRAGDNPAKPLVVLSETSTAFSPADAKVLRQAAAYLREAFLGRSGKPPPLRPPAGTVFQRDVWKCLATTARGEVLEYGQLAAAVGRPGAARAVGSACAANELPVFIPCHRVVASGGKPGGFTGGLAWKTWLLAREGCPPAGRGRKR